MSNQKNDPYEAVIADLEKQKFAIQAMIDALKAFSAGDKTVFSRFPFVPPIGQPQVNAERSAGNTGGEFTGKSMADATKIVLTRNGKPMNNSAILEALEAGGLKSESQQPLNTLGSVLNRRMNDAGDIVRVGRGTWGLAEWIDGQAGPEADADDGLPERFE